MDSKNPPRDDHAGAAVQYLANGPGIHAKILFGLVWCLLNSWTFVALKLGCGKARGGRIPAVGCNRRATQPQPNFGATRRAAVLFRGDFVAHSLQIATDMLVVRASSPQKIPCRKCPAI